MKYYLILLIAFAFFISNCNITIEDDEDLSDEDITELIDEEDIDLDHLEELEDKMEELMNEEADIEESLIKKIVELKAKGAKSIKVDIKIVACRLNISPGTKELFKGGFAFSKEKWKPIVIYSVKNDIGFLSIEQPDNKKINFNSNDQYVWSLKFTEKLPIDLDLEIGAGVSKIKLADLKINNFNMTMGVGKNEIDLRGNWKQNSEIHLDGGIGYTKVYLPDNIGVKVNIIKGLGSVDVENMTKKNDRTYVNEWYKKSDKTINIYIKTGIGSIEIE